MQNPCLRLGSRLVAWGISGTILLGCLTVTDSVSAAPRAGARRAARSRNAGIDYMSDYSSNYQGASSGTNAPAAAIVPAVANVPATAEKKKPEGDLPELETAFLSTDSDTRTDLTSLPSAPTDSPAFTPSSAAVQKPAMGNYWFTDFDAALKASRETQRPILLHLYMAYCGPCKRMEELVFSQETIQTLMGTYFVTVKLDGNTVPALCTRLGVTSFPADVILLPDGKAAAKRTGFQDAANYSAFLASTAEKLHVQPTLTPVGLETAPAELASADAPKAKVSKVSANLTVPAAGTDATDATAVPELASIADVNSEETLDLLSLDPIPGDSLSAKAPSISSEAPSGSSETRLTADANAPRSAAGNETEEASDGTVELELLSLERPEDVPPAQDLSSAEAVQVAVDEADLPGFAEERPLQHTSFKPSDAANSASDLSSAEDAAPVMLEGFCPVSMVENQTWIRGNTQFGLRYGDGLYFFASEAAKEKFNHNPEFYALVFDGLDVVLLTENQQKTLGDRRFGIRYDNMNFVFATDESREQFRSNPEIYAARARQVTAQNPGRTTR